MAISKKFSPAILQKMRDWHAEGLSGYQIYALINESGLHVSYDLVIKTMRGLGFKPSGRHHVNDAHAKRISEIIAMRRGGAILEEIGASFGVTRERIRQILLQHSARTGETGLVGWTPAMRARNAENHRTPKPKCARPSCNNAVKHSAQTYCGRPCLRRHTCERNAGLAARIIESRLAGVTWKQIVADTGTEASQLNRVASRHIEWRGNYTEADICAVWPQHSIVAERLIARIEKAA